MWTPVGWQVVSSEAQTRVVPGQWFRVSLWVDFERGEYVRMQVAGFGQDAAVDLGGLAVPVGKHGGPLTLTATLGSENACGTGQSHPVFSDDLRVRPAQPLAHEMKNWLLVHALCKHHRLRDGSYLDVRGTPGAACEAIRALSKYRTAAPGTACAGPDPRPEALDKNGQELFQPGSPWFDPGTQTYGWQQVDTDEGFFVYEDSMAYGIRALHAEMLRTGDDTLLPTVRAAYEKYNSCTQGDPLYDPDVAWTGYLAPGATPCGAASNAGTGKLYHDLSGAGILGLFRALQYPTAHETSFGALTAHPPDSRTRRVHRADGRPPASGVPTVLAHLRPPHLCLNGY